MEVDFSKEEQIKYRENLINDYRKDYPENLERLKENYILLKTENKGSEFLSNSLSNVLAIMAIFIAFSICDINLQKLYGILGDNYNEYSLLMKLLFATLIIIFIFWGRSARMQMQKNIIEMNVIEEIYPYINK